MDARGWARWWRTVGRPTVVHLLWLEWDPIGIREVDGPANEYDCMADPIGSELRKGAKAADIAVLLGSSASEHFELGPDPEADARAAEALVSWYAVARLDADPG